MYQDNKSNTYQQETVNKYHAKIVLIYSQTVDWQNSTTESSQQIVDVIAGL